MGFVLKRSPRLSFGSGEEEERETRSPGLLAQGGSRPGKKGSKIAECKIREQLEKGKRKEKRNSQKGKWK